MTPNDILKANTLDILFEHRNKSYGAYTLRKYYNNRLGIALSGTFGGIFLLLMVLRPGDIRKPVIKSNPVVVIEKLIPPGIKVPEVPPIPRNSQPAARPTASEKYTSIIEIVTDRPDMPDFTDLRELDGKAIAATRVPGDPFAGIQPPTAKLNLSQGNGKLPDEAREPLLQKSPEFPGGIQAWLQFLNRHLTVPAELEAGEKKTVMIKFDVDTDGSVTGFVVTQSAGSRYDNEVIRVLKKMPKWKPAIRDGQPISTTFTQPVTFMGLEE